MTQFIGVYENTFSKEYCEKVIQYFETMNQNGFVQNRQHSEKVEKIHKDDLACYGHDVDEMNFANSGSIFKEFNDIFWTAYREKYAVNFGVLETSGKHNNFSFKIQKTPIGGGYHFWHYETSSRTVCQRLLTWTLYLNDVEEGGETEFLYQHKRIKAKQGTLVIFPASFTHTHRGNPPISNEKYIVTGWTEF